jgi:hypothetical protein
MSIPNDPARPERAPHITDSEETAEVQTARPGDHLLTELGWHVVTAVRLTEPDPSRVEILTATPHAGHAWLYDVGAEVQIRRHAPGHPSWCSPKHCRATDPVAPYHWSPPVTARAFATAGWNVTAQVWKAADEPLDEGRAALFLVFEEQVPVIGARFVLDLEDEQAVQLHRALGPLVAALAHQAATRGGSR